MDPQAASSEKAPEPGRQEPQGVTNAMKAPVKHGAIWSVVQNLATSGLRLAGNLVLTHLLFPEAFGRVALVQTLFFAVSMFTDVGLRDSVIRHERGDEPAFLDTVWTLKAIRGAFVALIVSIAAVPYAHFYGEPEVMTMIWVLSLAALMDSLSSTKLLRLARHMRLRPLVLLELTTQVVSLVVMIVLAVWVKSAWVLVAGQVVSAFFHMVASFVAIPGRNDRFRLEPEARRDVTVYGRWIVVSSALTFLSSSADTLVFAKLGGVGAIGVYAIANNLASFPASVLNSLTDRVAFPLYSRYVGEGGDLRALFIRASKPLLVLGGWSVGSVMAVAQAVITTLYDPRYESAGPMLKILALGAWFELLTGNVSSMLKAVGSPRILAIGVATRVAVLVLFLAPVTKYLGIYGGLWVLTGASAARWLVSAAMLKQTTATHWWLALLGTGWVVLSGWVASAVGHAVGGGPIVTGAIGLLVSSAFWIWPALRAGLIDLARNRSLEAAPHAKL